MTEYRDIFEDAIEDFPTDHDAVKAQMVKEGVPFKSVTRVFNQLMIDTKRAFTKEGRDEVIRKVLNGRSMKTEKGFNGRVNALMVKIPGTTERSAGAMIRYYCKANDVPVYKRPARNMKPRVSFTKQFCDFLEANPFIKEEEVVKYLTTDRAKYIHRNMNTYMEIWRMVQAIVRKHNNGA